MVKIDININININIRFDENQKVGALKRVPNQRNYDKSKPDSVSMHERCNEMGPLTRVPTILLDR